MDYNDLKVLNEVYKGSKMGMEAIHYIEDKIDNHEFKKEVKNQYNDYQVIAEKIENTIEQNKWKLDEISAKNKMISWTSIKMQTAIDDTVSHMSEMLIQGTVMGIIEGVRLSNKNPNLDKQTEAIVDEFVKIGEDNIQVLKIYL